VSRGPAQAGQSFTSRVGFLARVGSAHDDGAASRVECDPPIWSAWLVGVRCCHRRGRQSFSYSCRCWCRCCRASRPWQIRLLGVPDSSGDVGEVRSADTALVVEARRCAVDRGRSQAPQASSVTVDYRCAWMNAQSAYQGTSRLDWPSDKNSRIFIHVLGLGRRALQERWITACCLLPLAFRGGDGSTS
jgi:hypothetical protein